MEILPYNYNVMERLRFHGKARLGVYFGVELEVRIPSKEAGMKNPAGADQPVLRDCDCEECVRENQRTLKAFEEQKKKWERWKDIPMREEIGSQIAEWFGDFLLFKHDGSIGGTDPVMGFGVEMVTAPATLSAHRARWKGFFEKFDGKLVAHESCGMHVHVGRAALSSNDIQAFYYFVNEPSHAKFVTKIAGRSSERWAKRIQKTPDQIVPAGKYEAVNLCPKDTIEVRVFASVVDYHNYMKNLEFVAALAHWVKGEKLGYGQAKLEDFKLWVVEKEKVYPELAKWLGENRV